MTVDEQTTAEHVHPARCQQCQKPLESPLYCATCQRLYPAEGLDYFSLLGTSPRYDVDIELLRRRYFQIACDVHPDRLAASDPQHQALGLRIIAKLNEAYRVLLDPVLRAEYLLKLSAGDEVLDEKRVPPELLAETLELREQIEQARAAGDQDKLAELRSRIEQGHSRVLERIAELARRLPGDAALRQELRTALNAVRYYQRMLAEL